MNAASLIELRPGGSRPPLVMIHALSGTLLPYLALTGALDGASPVYGIEADGLDGKRQPLRDVASLARSYAVTIRDAFGGAPVTVLGWSFGGIVAAEVAARLAASGASPSAVLIDVQRLNPSRPNRMLDADEELVEFGRLMMSGTTPAAAKPPTLAELRAIPARARLAHLFETIVAVRPRTPVAMLHDFLRVFRANLVAHDAYVPAEIRRVAALFVRSHGQTHPERDPSLGWRRWFADGIDAAVAPGDHDSILDASNVTALAACINQWQSRHVST
ncbi:alpha/beta fold hydrolase [Burkholderia stagnalis]|uniref:thioesterase domain-containing protein n=1 Tax=Burkholderia stagnalis TaxID=1503054 RepID=UPI000F5F0E78|nr:alpha/beta fold hydrolase [Burkholderia stagnalis]RQY11650.1 alpha/beta fold hydrolase [Burkholderia stagnalis]